MHKHPSRRSARVSHPFWRLVDVTRPEIVTPVESTTVAVCFLLQEFTTILLPAKIRRIEVNRRSGELL